MPQFERKPLAAAILMMFSAPVALAQAQTGSGSQPQSDSAARAVAETV